MSLPAQAQILCINCYDQNARVNTGGTSLIANGSFETTTCNTWPGFWDVYCPASSSYVCDIQDWTCTGGGTATYSLIFDGASTAVPDGLHAAYLGNSFCEPCSANPGDTSCFIMQGCVVTGIPTGYPLNSPDLGGSTGVSLVQTVSGLVIGTTYALEFWVGGEDFGGFPVPGLFGVDVGFGITHLRNKPTDAGDVGTRYEVIFNATSTAHTVKFTNWGHMLSNATELIVDDVLLVELGSPSAAFSVSQSGCAFTVQFTNQSSVGSAPYVWDMGDGTTYTTTDVTHTYSTPGTYTVTLSISGSGCGGADSTSQTITVAEPTAIEALFTAVQVDQCSGLMVTTTNLSTGPSSLVYTWNMGDGTTITGNSASHTYSEVGTYTITVTAYDPLCDEDDTFQLDVTVLASPLVDHGILVPNIFSPNGDGLNDKFFPIPGAGSNVVLNVWDRWGMKMFETTGQYKPWDGRTPGNKPVPDGVYFYILEYSIPCTGERVEGKVEGYVHVVGSTM